jgi:RNA polymerase-binding transcription factor DksA
MKTSNQAYAPGPTGYQSASDLEKRLRAEATQLVGELNSTAPDEWNDVQRDDMPAFEELREMEYSHIDSLHHRLREVEAALERVNTKKFGLCARCHKRIEQRRLQNDPAVALCLDCQAQTEKSLRFASL